MKQANFSECTVSDISRQARGKIRRTLVESIGANWRGYATRSVLIAVLASAALMTSAHAQQIAAQTQERAPPDDTGLKWVILALALAGVLPLAAWIRRYPSIAPKIWMFMGALPFAQAAIPHLNIALISWADWPGYVKGAEFSVLDLLTLALFLALPRARDPLPFRLPMALYFVAVLLAAFQAMEPVAALFYPWQLARMFLLYVVVVRSCADERFIPALLTGMAISLCFEAFVVIWQRFALGELQTTGTFTHQNGLGVVSHLVVFPFLALLLAGSRRWLAAATLVAGAIIAVLTVSRATIGLAGLGYVALFAISALRRPTKWKAVVGLVGVFAIAIVAVVALASIEQRFAAVPESGVDEREAFKSAAAMVLADHPMGIGANNYAYFAAVEGYSRQARVPLYDTVLGSAPQVHNVYWMTAAETGYFGLIALVLLLIPIITNALVCGWRNPNDPRSEVLLGFGVALLVVYIHSYFEFAILTVEIQYLFVMTIGAIAGLALQLGYRRRGYVRRNRPFAFVGGNVRRKNAL